VKNLSPTSTQKINEKNYDTLSKHTTTTAATTKVEPLQLNMGNDQQQSYRANDGRRDEGVNTIDSTFRR
jgi:hypothetical protein